MALRISAPISSATFSWSGSKTVLPAAEQHMAKSLPGEKNRDLLKQVRTHLIEMARPALEALVLGITIVKVLSLHHDISTSTGEDIVVFTLAEPPLSRDKDGVRPLSARPRTFSGGLSGRRSRGRGFCMGCRAHSRLGRRGSLSTRRLSFTSRMWASYVALIHRKPLTGNDLIEARPHLRGRGCNTPFVSGGRIFRDSPCYCIPIAHNISCRVRSAGGVGPRRSQLSDDKVKGSPAVTGGPSTSKPT